MLVKYPITHVETYFDDDGDVFFTNPKSDSVATFIPDVHRLREFHDDVWFLSENGMVHRCLEYLPEIPLLSYPPEPRGVDSEECSGERVDFYDNPHLFVARTGMFLPEDMAFLAESRTHELGSAKLDVVLKDNAQKLIKYHRIRYCPERKAYFQFMPEVKVCVVLTHDDDFLFKRAEIVLCEEFSEVIPSYCYFSLSELATLGSVELAQRALKYRLHAMGVEEDVWSDYLEALEVDFEYNEQVLSGVSSGYKDIERNRHPSYKEDSTRYQVYGADKSVTELLQEWRLNKINASLALERISQNIDILHHAIELDESELTEEALQRLILS